MTTTAISYPDQMVCLLPVDGPLAQDELLPLLPPDHRRREWFTLSTFFPPEVRRQGDPSGAIDWMGLGQALVAMASAAQAKLDPERPTEYHIASRAPLSVAALLGYTLQGFSARHVFHNRTRSEEWQTFRLGPRASTYRGDVPVAVEFFTTRPKATIASPSHESSPISEASGWVALCISLLGPIERAAVRAALSGELADIVELSVGAPVLLTPENISTAVEEIRSAVSMIKARYQQAKGVALFYAGPSPLAFFIGRELNPKAVPCGATRLYDYRAPSKSYEQAYELPIAQLGAPHIGQTDGDKIERRRVFDTMMATLDDFHRTFTQEDLSSPNAEVISAHIKSLRLPREPAAGPTRLTLLRDQLELGEGILEALRPLSETEQKQVGLLFLLHEVLHFEQNLVHGNYRRVGQAAVALGQLDFLADVFSLEAAVRWSVRRGGFQAEEQIANITEGFLNAYLRGVEAFDRLEQGNMLRRLSERRLRRYLTWYVQRERSTSIRSVADLHTLCRTHLVVEMAPLKGFLDNQYEKMVDGTLPMTRLVIACDDELILVEQSPNFNAASLLDAVRHFRHDDVQPLVRHIVEPKERRLLLCRWRQVTRRD